MPEGLISDPEVQLEYQARGPEDPATSSAHKIRSKMDRGMTFADADEAATIKGVAFLKGVQEGIGAANSEANNSGRIYLDADELSTANVKSVATMVLCLRPPDMPSLVPPGSPGIGDGPVGGR